MGKARSAKNNTYAGIEFATQFEGETSKAQIKHNGVIDEYLYNEDSALYLPEKFSVPVKGHPDSNPQQISGLLLGVFSEEVMKYCNNARQDVMRFLISKRNTDYLFLIALQAVVVASLISKKQETTTSDMVYGIKVEARAQVNDRRALILLLGPSDVLNEEIATDVTNNVFNGEVSLLTR